MTKAIRLFVGLGNPGAEYEHTRHNAGTDCVILLAEAFQATFKAEKKFHGRLARATVAGVDVRFLVPQTFYNATGRAVLAVAQFYRIPLDEIMLLHDELDLPLGVAKLKFGGGHGGNNGVRDTMSAFGGKSDFARLRLGVGHPGHKDRVTGYLLSRPPAAERETLTAVFDEVRRVVPTLLEGHWERAATALHTATRPGTLGQGT